MSYLKPGGRGQVDSHVVTQVDALQKRATFQPLLRDGECGRLRRTFPKRRNLDFQGPLLEQPGAKVNAFKVIPLNSLFAQTVLLLFLLCTVVRLVFVFFVSVSVAK